MPASTPDEMRYQGLLYRALNPVYAQQPLSGRGAELYGGRFNKRGTAALYTSLSPETAIRESNQVGTLQPTTLIAYQADITPIFDTRNDYELSRYGLTKSDLADPAWRDRATRDGGAPTQTLSEVLIKAGYAGLLTRSFAAGASENDVNLVLWKWADTGPATLRYIDEEDRLGIKGA